MTTLSSDPPLDALLTFLAVARRGRYTAAGAALGVNHSTVSRRITALERSLGGRVLARTPSGWEVTGLGRKVMEIAERVEESLRELAAPGGELTDSSTDARPPGLRGAVRIAAPEAFTAVILAPALTALRRPHPELAVELIAVTQRARQNRSGVDLEIVAGRPRVLRAYALPVFAYALRLYAAGDYLRTRGEPENLAALSRHPLVYYVESALQVDALDRALQELPPAPPSLRSTSVFAHIEATAAGAGIGLLPDFVADADPRLERVLDGVWSHPLSYWAVARDEGARNPALTATLAAVEAEIAHRLDSR